MYVKLTGMNISLLPDCFAVGLSGGADSVALLYRCLEIPGKRIVALHFNHGFSDENGDESEAYCRALCSRLGVRLIVGACVIEWDKKTTKEVFARQQRFSFFKRAMQEEGMTALALAHHAGDRAENLVLRLARGSSLEGLVSFREQSPFPGWPEATIFRPLLDETHETFTAWLKARGETWIEDTSNVDTTIPRNAIRHYVRGVLPHFVSGANLSADILAEENAYINEQVDRAIILCDHRNLVLSTETPLVLQRRALRRWMPEALTYTQLQALAQLPEGAPYNITRDVRVVRTGAMAWTRYVQRALEVPPSFCIEHTGVYTFGTWKIAVGEGAPVGSNAFVVKLPLPLFVRSRQPGDKISPKGFKGSRKVQDVLTDLRVPACERIGYPLFFDARSNRLLYVPGLRPAQCDETLCETVYLWREE